MVDYTTLMRTEKPGAAPQPTGDDEADRAARAEYMSQQAAYEQVLEAIQQADFLVNSDAPTGERAQKEVVRSLQRLDALGEDRIAAALWPQVESDPAYKRFLDPEGYAADQAAAEAAQIAAQIAENQRLLAEAEARAAEAREAAEADARAAAESAAAEAAAKVAVEAAAVKAAAEEAEAQYEAAKAAREAAEAEAAAAKAAAEEAENQRRAAAEVAAAEDPTERRRKLNKHNVKGKKALLLAFLYALDCTAGHRSHGNTVGRDGLDYSGEAGAGPSLSFRTYLRRPPNDHTRHARPGVQGRQKGKRGTADGKLWPKSRRGERRSKPPDSRPLCLCLLSV